MSVDFVASMTGRSGSSGNYSAEASSSFPIESSKTAPFFPPVCLTSHWDPTAMLRRIVPQGPSVPLPMDFRPWSKVCLNYRTAGPIEDAAAPAPPAGMVFGPGGEFYPPSRYSSAIDNESRLRRLDRPLGTCDKDQYEPNKRGDMYVGGLLVPRTYVPTSKMVDELSMPKVLIRPTGGYVCRREDDSANIARSGLLFNNATKQDRYKQQRSHYDLKGVDGRQEGGNTAKELR